MAAIVEGVTRSEGHGVPLCEEWFHIPDRLPTVLEIRASWEKQANSANSDGVSVSTMEML